MQRYSLASAVGRRGPPRNQRGRLGRRRRRRSRAPLEELGSPPLALLPFNRGLQPGHRVGESGHVAVDAAPEPVERGGAAGSTRSPRPSARLGAGPGRRPPPPAPLAPSPSPPPSPPRGPPSQPPRPPRLARTATRAPIASPRRACSPPRRSRRRGEASSSPPPPPRRPARAPPPERRCRRCRSPRTARRRRRRRPAAALHGLDEPRHVVEHRRRLLHRGGYVLHDGLETRLAGIAPPRLRLGASR